MDDKFIKTDIIEFINLGPDGRPDFKPLFPNGFIIPGSANRIRVTPEELLFAAEKISNIADSYTSIYRQLMQQVQTMGSAWEGEDNLAFVEQISGFCEELSSMATKLETASQTLRTQAQNYIGRQNDNITQVKKLTN